MTRQEIYDAVAKCWLAGDIRTPLAIVGERPKNHSEYWVWDVLTSTMECYGFRSNIPKELRMVAHICHLTPPDEILLDDCILRKFDTD